MMFLTPTVGLLAAALALPAVVALYLLKLRRRPVRVSSTLLWASAVRDLEVNVPLRMLRRSWLLVLHLLIAALLCAALARPTLRGGSEVGGRTVLIIDRSASMSATDGPGGRTRLEEALRAATELVGSGRMQGRQTAVIALGASAEIVTGFTGSEGAAAAALRRIEPSDQPGDLDAALRLADTLALDASEESRGGPVDVVLISDGGFAASPTAPTLSGVFRYVRVGPESKADAEPGWSHDNLGIVTLAARRDADDPAAVRVFVRIQNADARARTAALTLALNGETVERRTLEIAGATEAGPAQSPASFEVRTPLGGVVTVGLPGGDLLAADDTASAVLAPGRRPSVLLVQPPAAARSADDPGDGLSPDWLLGDALEEMGLASLRRVRPVDVAALIADPATRPDLVVLDRVSVSPLPMVPTLSFAVPIAAPGLRTTVFAGIQPIAGVLGWERDHPVLRDVTLDPLLFEPRTALTVDPGSRSRVLASSAAGPAIVLAEDDGVRRLVVSFEPGRSNWPITVGFSIFLSNAIDFLTLREERDAAIAFTTATPAWAPAEPGRSEVTLVGPITLRRSVAPGGGDNDEGRVDLGVVPRVGLYVSEGEGEASASPNAVAVNLADARESGLGVGQSVRVAGIETRAVAVGDGQRELWAWLVLAAAVLMAIEWFLYAWRARV